MKTKLILVFCALCLLLTLAACTQAPAETKAPETQAPETQAPETQAPATAAPETADAAIRGVIQGDVYTNDYLNLRITRPTGWIFYDEAQLAEMNNTTLGLWEDTDYADLISTLGTVIDMMETDANGNSVNLVLQPYQAVLDAYTDEQVFQLSEAVSKSQYEAVGYSLDRYETSQMQVGGEARTVLHIVLSVNGVSIDEYQILYRGEKYYGMLTVALFDTSLLQSVLDSIVQPA